MIPFPANEPLQDPAPQISPFGVRKSCAQNAVISDRRRRRPADALRRRDQTGPRDASRDEAARSRRRLRRRRRLVDEALVRDERDDRYGAQQADLVKSSLSEKAMVWRQARSGGSCFSSAGTRRASSAAAGVHGVQAVAGDRQAAHLDDRARALLVDVLDGDAFRRSSPGGSRSLKRSGTLGGGHAACSGGRSNKCA